MPQRSLFALPCLTQNWKRPVDSCFFTSWPAPLTKGHDSGTPVSSDLPAITRLLSVMRSAVCCSVAQSCLTLCNPVDCSTPGFPVPHCLLELAQTHIHWVGDAIWPSHPLLPPSPPALYLSQHQGSCPMSWLFASSGQNIGASASVLPMSIQGWFPLWLTDVIALPSKEIKA